MGVVYSTSIGNPWHNTPIDTRRKLNLDKSKGVKKSNGHNRAKNK